MGRPIHDSIMWFIFLIAWLERVRAGEEVLVSDLHRLIALKSPCRISLGS
jgi:hypothetical protein